MQFLHEFKIAMFDILALVPVKYGSLSLLAVEVHRTGLMPHINKECIYIKCHVTWLSVKSCINQDQS